MFAIAFDMVVSDLKKNYGEPYNNAYFAIGVILRKVNMDSTMHKGVSILPRGTIWQTFTER